MSDAVTRNASGQGNHPGYVGGIGRRGDVAEDDLIHLIGPNSGTLQDGDRGQPAEFFRRHIRQGTEGLDERGAHTFEDGDVEHGVLPHSETLSREPRARTDALARGSRLNNTNHPYFRCASADEIFFATISPPAVFSPWGSM